MPRELLADSESGSATEGDDESLPLGPRKIVVSIMAVVGLVCIVAGVWTGHAATTKVIPQVGQVEERAKVMKKSAPVGDTLEEDAVEIQRPSMQLVSAKRKTALSTTFANYETTPVATNLEGHQPLCSADLVKTMCSRLNRNTKEYFGDAVDKNESIVHSAELAEQLGVSRMSIQKFLREIGTTNMAPSSRKGPPVKEFAVVCKELCEKTISSFPPYYVPSRSNVGCFFGGQPGHPSSEPTCDVDLSPSALNNLQLPKDKTAPLQKSFSAGFYTGLGEQSHDADFGPSQHQVAAAISGAADPSKLSVAQAALLEALQFPEVSPRKVAQRVANMFYVYPANPVEVRTATGDIKPSSDEFAADGQTEIGRRLADTCQYSNDGECDEPTYCYAGTDSTDCGSASTSSPATCHHGTGNNACPTDNSCTPCATCSCSYGFSKQQFQSSTGSICYGCVPSPAPPSAGTCPTGNQCTAAVGCTCDAGFAKATYQAAAGGACYGCTPAGSTPGDGGSSTSARCPTGNSCTSDSGCTCSSGLFKSEYQTAAGSTCWGCASTAAVPRRRRRANTAGPPNWQSDVLRTAATAQGVVSHALNKMSSRQIPTLVTKWYGKNDQPTRTELIRLLSGVNDLLSNADYRHDENCDQYVYAYVYPTGPDSKDSQGKRIINLCNYYFKVQLGEQVGTLVHEGSHHLTIDEDDVDFNGETMYGRQITHQVAMLCQQGNSQDCTKCLKNADNLDYFVEDNLAQDSGYR